MIYWFKVLLLLIFLSSYIIAQDYKPGELLVLSKHSLINALIQSPTSSQSQLFLDQYNIKSIKKVTVKKPSSVHSSISPLLTFDENGMYQLEFEDTTFFGLSHIYASLKQTLTYLILFHAYLCLKQCVLCV